MEAETDSQEQADQTVPMIGAPSLVLVAVPIVSIAVAVAMALDNYIDPVFIWGGAHCNGVTAIGEMESCAGYPPAGLMVITVAVSGAIGFVVMQVNRWRGD